MGSTITSASKALEASLPAPGPRQQPPHAQHPLGAPASPPIPPSSPALPLVHLPWLPRGIFLALLHLWWFHSHLGLIPFRVPSSSVPVPSAFLSLSLAFSSFTLHPFFFLLSLPPILEFGSGYPCCPWVSKGPPRGLDQWHCPAGCLAAG